MSKRVNSSYFDARKIWYGLQVGDVEPITPEIRFAFNMVKRRHQPKEPTKRFETKTHDGIIWITRIN